MPPIPASTATFLVPLLLVIVERLATMSRGIADDLEGHVDKPPVFVPRRRSADDDGPPAGWFRLPWVSRLNHLHVTNMALLTGAFVLTAATESGLVRNILALVVVVVWVQLPLLEVDEYDELQSNVPVPWALYVHVAGTLAIAAFVVWSGGFTPGLFLTELDLFAPDVSTVLENSGQVGGLAVLAVVFAAASFGFLRLFEAQVRLAARNERP